MANAPVSCVNSGSSNEPHEQQSHCYRAWPRAWMPEECAVQIKRRNILHEMSNPFSVNLYFTLDSENYLNLKLQAPAVEVQEDTTDSRKEFERLILETPLA